MDKGSAWLAALVFAALFLLYRFAPDLPYFGVFVAIGFVVAVVVEYRLAKARVMPPLSTD